jgi:muconate cycloisomerase
MVAVERTYDQLVVETVTVTEVSVPRTERNRISTSYATLPNAHHALVEVGAGGLTGVGEAPAERWWTGEDAASVRNAVERYLAPAVVGKPVAIRDAGHAMNRALAANRYAKAAVEMALWDLLGKAAGLPLATLLGGDPSRPTPVKYVIGTRPPVAAVAELRAGRSLGFGTFKVKVGGRLEDDLARVGALAGELGPGERLGVDANGGWPHAVALTALRPLEELGIAFLEQPVPRRDARGLADLTRRSAVPIVAHESLATHRDALDAATGGLAHVWALTPSTHGGLATTIDLLGIARAAGISCLLGSTVELGVASAMLAHLGAAYPEIHASPIPSDVIGPLYHDGDVVTAPPVIRDGAVHAPPGPGLGVQLDRDRIAAFAP